MIILRSPRWSIFDMRSGSILSLDLRSREERRKTYGCQRYCTLFLLNHQRAETQSSHPSSVRTKLHQRSVCISCKLVAVREYLKGSMSSVVAERKNDFEVAFDLYWDTIPCVRCKPR